MTKLRLHGGATVGAYEGVRILTIGERNNLHLRLGAEQLESGAEGGLLPGVIAVVEEEDIARVAHE